MGKISTVVWDRNPRIRVHLVLFDNTIVSCKVVKRIYYGADTYIRIIKRLVKDEKAKDGQRLEKKEVTVTEMGGWALTYIIPGSFKRLMFDRRRGVCLMPDDYIPEKLDGWHVVRQIEGKAIAVSPNKAGPSLGQEYFNLCEKHYLASEIKAYGANPAMALILIIAIIAGIALVGYWGVQNFTKPVPPPVVPAQPTTPAGY